MIYFPANFASKNEILDKFEQSIEENSEILYVTKAEKLTKNKEGFPLWEHFLRHPVYSFRSTFITGTDKIYIQVLVQHEVWQKMFSCDF